MNFAIRLPVAFLLGLAFATGLFWFLWLMVSGTGSFGDLKPAVKIDFTALKHDTETETKREKVVQQKPDQDLRPLGVVPAALTTPTSARSACRSIPATSVMAFRSDQTGT